MFFSDDFQEQYDIEQPCDSFSINFQDLNTPLQFNFQKIEKQGGDTKDSQKSDEDENHQENISFHSNKTLSTLFASEKEIRADSKTSLDIQINIATRERYQQIKKENKMSPNKLMRYFHSELMLYLKMLLCTKQLNKPQSVAVNAFQKNYGSSQAFTALFELENLKAKCVQYLHSSQFVKNIMKSPRMDMSNKLLMLNSLEKMRRIPLRRKKCEIDRN